MKKKDIIEFQMLSNQMEQINEYMKKTESQIISLKELIKSLSDFKTTKKEEVLFPIANGIFAKGHLSDNKELMINVGEGVVVKRTIKEAEEMLRRQLFSIEESQAAAASHQDEIYKKLKCLKERVDSEQSKDEA